jgi:hypothetical protein
MAKILLEDMVLYLISFYLITSIIFSMGIFNTVLPNQRWNSTTSSLETYAPDPSPSIFGDMQDFNATLAQYGQGNNSAIDANNILNPVGVVFMLQTYLGFIVAVITSSMLAQVLTPFIGVQFAALISFVLNLMLLLVGIRVLSGRLRWN